MVEPVLTFLDPELLTNYGKVDKEKLDLLEKRDQEKNIIIDNLKHSYDFIKAEMENQKRETVEREKRHQEELLKMKEEMKVLDKLKMFVEDSSKSENENY